MYGIWNCKDKRYVFGIKAETKEAAMQQFKKVCQNWRSWKYEVKWMPDDVINKPNPVWFRIKHGIGE